MARPALTMPGLVQILKASRRNNQRSGLSGLLVYTQGQFLQVLEGVDHCVDETFSRIAADDRHSACKIIQETQIFEPDFGQWLMGFWTDQITTEQRSAGIVAIPELLQEFDSEWLEQKSKLNQLLHDEINILRVGVAA